MKRILVLIICTLLILTCVSADGTQTKFSWYITGEEVENVNPFNPVALPDSLIVTPGFYTYDGQTYDMNNEGLYRFAEINGVNRQCIVYQTNVHKLLSSLSWITTHGNSDGTMTYEQLKTTAKTRKINITCGKVVGLARDILGTTNTRQISTFALDNITNFDDGHVLLEVWRTDLSKWVLYDLDNNFVFADTNGDLLSFWEVLPLVDSGNFEMKPIASDTTMDISNFKVSSYDAGIYFETAMATEQQKYNWLKRVFAFPTIYEGGIYYSVDSTRTRDLTAADTTYLTGLGITYQVMTESAFLTKYYNQ